MRTHTSSASLPWVVLCCGAFPWVVVPAVGFLVAHAVPTAFAPAMLVAGVLGVACAAFAALAGRRAAGLVPIRKLRRVGTALGLVYLAMLVAALLIGAVAGLLSPWLYELVS